MLKNNCCDGIYRSFDIHFTGICHNKCPYCIDKRTTYHPNNKAPDWRKIADTVLKHKYRIDDVLILGGEPLLFPKELLCLIKEIKKNSNLKVYMTTSFPESALIDWKTLARILVWVDGINISAHHYDDEKAREIRGAKFPNKEFYLYFPYKEKIRICLNLVKGVLDTEEEIREAVSFFGGFGSIKLSELQHSPEHYVSFEKIMNMKLPSPYYHGCQTDISYLFPENKNKIILKRSCFMIEPTLKAGLKDGLKVLYKTLVPSYDSVFGVIFEDGTLKPKW